MLFPVSIVNVVIGCSFAAIAVMPSVALVARESKRIRQALHAGCDQGTRACSIAKLVAVQHNGGAATCWAPPLPIFRSGSHDPLGPIRGAGPAHADVQLAVIVWKFDLTNSADRLPVAVRGAGFRAGVHTFRVAGDTTRTQTNTS